MCVGNIVLHGFSPPEKDRDTYAVEYRLIITYFWTVIK
jgi:hypothetical protein